MSRKILLHALPVIVVFLASCGPTSDMDDGAMDLGSRPNPDRTTSGGSTGGGQLHGLLATCSGFDDSTTQLSGVLENYIDPLSGQTITSYIRLKLAEYPASLHTTNTHYLNFFRWSEDVPGSPVFNDRAVKFYFIVNGTTNFLNAGDPKEALSRATISEMINTHNLDSFGFTSENFLDRVVIVLTGVELQYDVLQVRLFTGGNNSYFFDVLIPAFSANPNTYAASHPSPTLQSLHPNWQLRNSGASDTEFRSYASEACTLLYTQTQSFDSNRLPASLGRAGQKLSLWQRLKQELSHLWTAIINLF